MTELAERRCVACEGGAEPLSAEQVGDLARQVPAWTVREQTLVREITVKNFKAALALVNSIGAVAEQENHHPDIAITGWNHVKIELTTHAMGGLSENDFILAAKITSLMDDAEKKS
ncbi:MAG: 4a-hydroxytetrahydrobiopterin dehydratase [Chloroflexota bacterium]